MVVKKLVNTTKNSDGPLYHSEWHNILYLTFYNLRLFELIYNDNYVLVGVGGGVEFSKKNNNKFIYMSACFFGLHPSWGLEMWHDYSKTCIKHC